MKIKGVTVEPWMAAIPVALGLGSMAYLIASIALDDGVPAGVVPPASFQGVPFAAGIRKPAWPVQTRDSRIGQVAYRDIHGNTHGNYDRRFGASRDGRYHVGIDLYANNGDPVIAIADGVVTNAQTFHLGSWALFVDHGPVVVMYGEVEEYSWRDFGVYVGSTVKKGQPIARVACMRGSGSSCSSHMLHFETYRDGSGQNKTWHVGSPAPAAILDPTLLLLQASKSV